MPGMTSQPVQSRATSRWGSLLQQAVAGVESRLDNILADDDEKNAVAATMRSSEQPRKREGMTMPSTTRSSADLSRQSSTSKKPDRLQERLAKAVVNRSNPKSLESTGLSSSEHNPSINNSNSRASIDTDAESTASDIDGVAQEERDLRHSVTPDERTKERVESYVSEGELKTSLTTMSTLVGDEHSNSSRPSIDSRVSSSARPLTDLPRNVMDVQDNLSDVESNRGPKLEPADYEQVIDHLRSNCENAELRRQEEMHDYLERIDALHAKLQYLTKEAIEFAKQNGAQAEEGSDEQKIAIKDEKIALLMEEGQKLSQNELNFMTTIKKLRTKSAEDDKSVALHKHTAEEADKVAKAAQERARRAEAKERESYEKVKALNLVEVELEETKSERDFRDTIISNLKGQLAQANDSKILNEVNVAKALLEAERISTTDLRDDLSNARIERELSDERHRAQIREQEEKAKHENERTKVRELELRGEIGVLESRLETYRTRAEEASSGSSENTQAKLLRQIETLQTQYAVASDNWRGIENSLLSRIADLGNDRDETAKKEVDVRRKARDMGIKSRRLEDQYEQATSRIREMESELAEQSHKSFTLQEALTKAGTALAKVQQDLKAEQESFQAKLEESLEAARKESALQTPELQHPRIQTASPAISSRRRVGGDKASQQNRQNQSVSHSTTGLGLTDTAISPLERPSTRRSSAQNTHISGSVTPLRRHSTMTIAPASSTNDEPQTPNSYTDHQEDFFDGVITPATPERTINDMFSASTAAAGPSVQLVERMIAAVRRLESEKAAFRDELDRLSAQRDEAREQVVTLMREAEEKRTADAKIASLESQVTDINQRYQTTLEMLGEKSEIVEELQADVADVKQMYRDLVERTLK